MLGNTSSMIPDVAAFMKKKFFYGIIATELNRSKRLVEFFKQYENFIIQEVINRLITHMRTK